MECMDIWSSLLSFGIFYVHLVHFMVIWYVYIFHFGILYKEKSGNPVSKPNFSDKSQDN
jgi:hypothetical protein